MEELADRDRTDTHELPDEPLHPTALRARFRGVTDGELVATLEVSADTYRVAETISDRLNQPVDVVLLNHAGARIDVTVADGEGDP
jgi:hypothetical protein